MTYENKNHSFRFIPGNGNLFFLTARWNEISRSIKILATGANSENICSLDYVGTDNRNLQFKALSNMKSSVIESGILDAPAATVFPMPEWVSDLMKDYWK